jgi:hypothetical protein
VLKLSRGRLRSGRCDEDDYPAEEGQRTPEHDCAQY